MSVFMKVYRLMFPLHSPPSDVFLLYLVTSFQKQTHVKMVFLGLSRKFKSYLNPNGVPTAKRKGMTRGKCFSSFMYSPTCTLDLYVYL